LSSKWSKNLLSSRILTFVVNIVNYFFHIWSYILYKLLLYYDIIYNLLFFDTIYIYTVRYFFQKRKCCGNLITFYILLKSVLTLILSSGEDIAHRQVNQPKIKECSWNSVPVVHSGWQFTWNYIGVITSFILLFNLSNEVKRRSNPQWHNNWKAKKKNQLNLNFYEALSYWPSNQISLYLYLYREINVKKNKCIGINKVIRI